MLRRALRPLPLAVAIVAIALFSVAAHSVVRLVEQRQAAVVDTRVAQGAASVYAVLQAEVQGTLHLATGLAGLVVYDPSLGDIDDGGPVAQALAEVYARSDHLRNIGLAPDNVLRHVYPLAGNESAIGLRYEDVPEQWVDVQRAMESGRTVLAGPVDLVQGGRGLVNRTPVHLEDGRYWGIVSLVVDVDSVLHTVDQVAGDVPIEWAIRTTPQNGGGSIPVAGDQDLFVDADDRRVIEVPGGAWEMAAVAAPALLAEGSSLTAMRAAIMAIGVLVGLLAMAVVVQREGFKELSLHDPLTGLPNRRLLTERLEHAVRASGRGGRGCAVLALDLDGFKQVNDTFGHSVGDAALREAAVQLVGAVRGRDTIARLGGDEFVVVLPDTTLPDALELAQRLRRGLVRTVGDERGVTRQLGATVGVAHGPTHAVTAGELLRLADLALYRGKRAGRGVVAEPDGEVTADDSTTSHVAGRHVDPEEQRRAASSTSPC